MIRRIKDIVFVRNEKTEENILPYIGLENIISWDSKYIDTNSVSEGINSIFHKEDILFGKLRPYLAKAFIPQYDGICSSEFIVMHANEGIKNRYFLYYILSHSVIDYIKNQVAGVKMPRTNWNSFSCIPIDIPFEDYQNEVILYLDKKTADIDNRISILSKQLDAYSRLKTSIINRAVTRGLDENVELKDSGVEWIGKIPKHWNIRRGKDLLIIISGFPADSDKFSLDSSFIPLVRIRDISSIDTEIYYEGEYPKWALIETQDLLIGMDGDFNVSKWKGGQALLNQRVCKIESKKMNKLFLAYAISFPLLELNAKTNSTTVKHLSVYGIEGLYFPIPPLSEQQVIATYLDDKCTKIDAAIANINKQIDALKRLKRALINEVITGKRAV